MRRSIFLAPRAIRDLYAIPRGVAGELTKALRVLETDPTPDNSTPIPERPGRHELLLLDYMAVYAVEETRIVILTIDAAE